MSWKSFAALGCSHGRLINEPALASALARIEDFKPDVRLHLGDGLNSGAFYSKKPEPEELEFDIQCLHTLIERYHPNYYINGNHCDRYWRGLYSTDPIRKFASEMVVERVSKFLRQNHTRHHSYYRIDKPGIRLGNLWFMHGFMYGMNAPRQHAEMFGNVVFAHLHTIALACARDHDHSIAACTGWLGDPQHEGVSYAKSSPQLMGWRNAITLGHYDTLGEKAPDIHIIQV